MKPAPFASGLPHPRPPRAPILLLALSLALCGAGPAAAFAAARGEPQPLLQQGGIPTPHPPDLSIPRTLDNKQQRDLMKANFAKMKRDAGQLLELAKSLQQELDKSSEDVLSLKVVDQAQQIEKLARQIKNTAKGP